MYDFCNTSLVTMQKNELKCYLIICYMFSNVVMGDKTSTLTN